MASLDHEQQRAAAFRSLFDAELRYVWNTLRYLGVHASDVCDVAHDVFMTVYQRLDERDPQRPVRPWLFVIAYHAASNYRRLARHRREVPDDGTEPQANEPSVEEHVAQAEQRQLLLCALQSIDLDKRAVLVMHDMDGIAMPEIAEALGVPLNTAYSRLRLARQELRANVVRRQGGGAP